MIKKGLKVKVLVGKDRNKEGEIIEIDRSNNRAKIKDINMVKKHVKTTKEKKGGIFSKESFIHISNLRLIDEKIKNKKKEGEVIEIDRANNRAKVKEINMVKKHVKTTKEKKGGIFPKESFIHISNLKLIDEKAAKKKEAKK